MNEIEDYIDYLTRNRGLAANTARGYRTDLMQFARFLDEYAPGTTPPAADYLAIRHFLGYLAERGVSRRSLARKTSAIKGFYRYLAARGAISGDPAAAVATPRFEAGLPKFLSEEDAGAILERAKEIAKMKAALMYPKEQAEKSAASPNVGINQVEKEKSFFQQGIM